MIHVHGKAFNMFSNRRQMSTCLCGAYAGPLGCVNQEPCMTALLPRTRQVARCDARDMPGTSQRVAASHQQQH